MRKVGNLYCFLNRNEYIDNLLCYNKITLKSAKMNIKFNKSQRFKIRKFLATFHGRERTDLYDVFRAIAYIVYTCCQWRYKYLCQNEQSTFVRPIVGAFLSPFRSRWNPIAPSKVKEIPSTIDRPAINIYCRTGS